MVHFAIGLNSLEWYNVQKAETSYQRNSSCSSDGLDLFSVWTSELRLSPSPHHNLKLNSKSY